MFPALCVSCYINRFVSEFCEYATTITASSAKIMASELFIVQERQETVFHKFMPTMISRFFPYIMKFSVDNRNKKVTASILWIFARQSAVYRDFFGCTLLPLSTRKLIDVDGLQSPQRFDANDWEWPFGNSDSSVPTSNSILNSIVETAFSKDCHTTAVLVIKNGKIIAERYQENYNASTKCVAWSVGKSIVNMLIGNLVHNNKINLDQKVIGDITIKHLLEHRSGISWSETPNGLCDVSRMLTQCTDTAGYVKSRYEASRKKLISGIHWNYSSGDTNLLCEHLKFVTSILFPHQMFVRIGMQDSCIELDASGNFVGSSFLYTTARDLGRFGLLYLNRGRIIKRNNKTREEWIDNLFSPEWITESTKPRVDAEYGYHFWLNNQQKNYPHCPPDMFCAKGVFQQVVSIIPSKDLVIVRLGLSKPTAFNADMFISEIIKASQ
jgi:CubicO group peptidase (beta-lactamase class C family)